MGSRKSVAHLRYMLLAVALSACSAEKGGAKRQSTQTLTIGAIAFASTVSSTGRPRCSLISPAGVVSSRASSLGCRAAVEVTRGSFIRPENLLA